jgi:hypothetical protein
MRAASIGALHGQRASRAGAIGERVAPGVQCISESLADRVQVGDPLVNFDHFLPHVVLQRTGAECWSARKLQELLDLDEREPKLLGSLDSSQQVDGVVSRDGCKSAGS